MREYKYKVITDGSDLEDYVIKLREKETERVLDTFLHDSENSVYWAKEIDGNIFYSIDQIYDTEQQDATHLAVFMK